MKINLSKVLFLIMLNIGVMISISSNNWILIWCGLEISMISFMPLFVSNKIITAESAIKYFIVQSVSSSMLMLGMLIMIMKGEYNYDYMIKSSLLMKMGVAPFHNWILTVIEGLDLKMTFIMLTINKVTPITIMSYTNSNLILLSSINLVMASILSMNQNSIKKLITYSSMFNMSLMLMIIKMNLMWILYLMNYSILLAMMVLLMNKMKVMYINQVIMIDNKMINKMLVWTIMLSMGGMPPLMGFSIKYMVMQIMVDNNMYVPMFILITTSLVMMVVYLRMTFISIMSSSLSLKLLNFNMKLSSGFSLMINLLLLPTIISTKLIN
uniref:NADH dehydrogenase subunit 2 n=1 Tax=Limassolla dispunctata TaxID=3019670 RepID=UPI00300196A2